MTKASTQPQRRAARRKARRIDFLFCPAAVAQTLTALPHLAAVLGDPHDEGEPAVNLPGVRKSARELYRVFGNTHYAHLAQLLATLDACAGAGFTQPTLLRTRGRRPFVEAIAELHTAEHFRQGGHAIRGFDDAKGGGSVPDILVESGGVTAVVEVYCPQAWPGLAAYTQAITDRVKNLDRGIDYEFRIEHAQLEQFGANGRLLQLHPAQLSDGLDDQTRLNAVGSLLADLEAALDVGEPGQERVELAAINLVTTVELEKVAPVTSALPERAGSISGPSFGGYRPEAMFADIVERVIDKLQKGQAIRVVPDAVPVLVVEMSQSELTSELRHNTFYRPEFENTLNAMVTDLRGYGVVALCEAVECGRRLIPHFLVVDDTVTDQATARRLFS
jgi:hypothetical protein